MNSIKLVHEASHGIGGVLSSPKVSILYVKKKLQSFSAKKFMLTESFSK